MWRLQEVKISDENEKVNKKRVWVIADIESRRKRKNHHWKTVSTDWRSKRLENSHRSITALTFNTEVEERMWDCCYIRCYKLAVHDRLSKRVQQFSFTQHKHWAELLCSDIHA